MNNQVLMQMRLCQAIREMHHEQYEFILEARKALAGMQPAALADLAFMLRESNKLVDDMRKEQNNLQEQVEKVACVRWVQANLNDGANAEPIRGEFVTATPDVKKMASLPRRSTNPEAYDALMTYLGIPKDVVEKDLMRCHWPAFTEHITELCAEGRPLPNGIDPSKTYDVYRLLLRKRADAPSLDG